MWQARILRCLLFSLQIRFLPNNFFTLPSIKAGWSGKYIGHLRIFRSNLTILLLLTPFSSMTRRCTTRRNWHRRIIIVCCEQFAMPSSIVILLSNVVLIIFSSNIGSKAFYSHGLPVQRIRCTPSFKLGIGASTAYAASFRCFSKFIIRSRCLCLFW